ncbi:MAG: dihydropteroate synthase [Planctomycetes bacterium]|nr:dihydropteroate synthase [Planctomycetota bacterium]
MGEAGSARHPGGAVARPFVLGVLNVTPDSFSDGGRFVDTLSAIQHGLRLAADGADGIDVGGESTRPGAARIPEEEELARVLPVIAGLAREVSILISVDTSKAGVARRALDAGAGMVNDVTALGGDPEMASALSGSGARVVLMHMKGTPADMQRAPWYDDPVAEILAFLEERVRIAVAAGIGMERIIVDPGIGFGKRVSDNLRIIRNLDRFRALGLPVMVGASRKSFIGKILGRSVEERAAGNAAVELAAAARGAAYLRVHDVRATRDLLRMQEAIAEAPTRWDGDV